LIESALSAFEKLVRLLEPGTLSLHRFLRIYEVCINRGHFNAKIGKHVSLRWNTHFWFAFWPSFILRVDSIVREETAMRIPNGAS